MVAVDFVCRRLILRFPPTQLLYLDSSPVSRPRSHIMGIIIYIMRIVIMQRVTFYIIIYVSGMLQAVFRIIIMIAGTSGVVVVSKFDTFSTAQLLLTGVITVCLLR